MQTFLLFVLICLAYFMYVVSWACWVWFKQDLDEQTQRHNERMKIWDSIIDSYK
jgi:hypothetical protein